MTTTPIPSTTDDLIAELELCMRADCGIELESADICALLAERADLKQQLVAAGITTDNCEMFRRDAERYQWLREQEAEQGVSVVSIAQWTSAATCVAVTFVDGSFVDYAIDAAMNK